MEQLYRVIEEMKTMISSFHNKLDSIENRLNRLEKVDSIEHRVAVNQIDLSDIKEALEQMKDQHLFSPQDEFKTIHKRLDSHLIKIDRAEEEIILLKKEK